MISCQQTTPKDDVVQIRPGDDAGPDIAHTIKVEYEFSTGASTFKVDSVLLDRDNCQFVVICKVVDAPIGHNAFHTVDESINVTGPECATDKAKVYFIGAEKYKNIPSNTDRGYFYIEKLDDIPGNIVHLERVYDPEKK